MENYFLEWLVIVTLTFLAAASPGPDFVMVTRNSLVHSRKAGIYTGFGISLGICVHMIYCTLGLAVVISQSVMLFNAIKWAGATYLIYIGGKMLLSKGTVVAETPAQNKSAMTQFAAFKSGFFTNLLNPKATMFFLALFTQVIDPQTPALVMLVYAASIVLIGLIWWTFVAVVLTNSHVKQAFLRVSKWIDRLCGGLLIALGIRLALSKI
jgi:RhtB (resistance to homoserine/threonine) family protein